MNIFGEDLAVSLVDGAFIFSTPNQESPLVLPAYVAIQKGTTKVLAYGEEAKAMLGKIPSDMVVVKVLIEGVIIDQKLATSLFRFGVRSVLGKRVLVGPKVSIVHRACNPPSQELVVSMVIEGGARKIYVDLMGMATAIGMHLDVQEAEPKAVLSVSDDWFHFSIIALGLVWWETHGAIGSWTFVEDIRNHFALTRKFRPEFAALLSQLHEVGVNPDAVAGMPGWGTPSDQTESSQLTEQSLPRDEITIGLMPSLVKMTERIKAAIQFLPEEKRHQLNGATIHATGTALTIPGLAQMLADQLGYSVKPYPAEVHPSVHGCRTLRKRIVF